MKYLNKVFLLFIVCFLFFGSSIGMSESETIAASRVLLSSSPEAITSPEQIENTISLDLRRIEITELFKILSKKLGKNLIPSKNVTGRITLFLNDINYNDVLDIIMTSQGLAYEKKNSNTVIIMTESEYQSLYGRPFNEKKEILTLKLKHANPKMVYTVLNNIKSSVGNVIIDEATGTLILIDTPEKLTIMKGIFDSLDNPLTTEIFELQYAIATDIEDDISKLITEGSGKVLSDERTNSLLVTDLPGNMKKIKQAIHLLDQETRAVFIEAEIVEITLTDEFDAGIDWDMLLQDPALLGFGLAGTFPGATLLTTTSQQISLGSLGRDEFSVVLDFLKTIGDTRILSRPRIAVINNEEALVHVGKREPIITGTTSQSSESTLTSDSVEFVDIGIKLTVVPTINRDGFVTMKIKIEVSSAPASDVVTTGTSTETRSRIPVVTTSESETTVKIKDGTMIMIAGLRKTHTSESRKGIPFLSDIPILGLLFGETDNQRNQEEIIVFITPHIIRGAEMLSWDKEKLNEFPEHIRPENRGYFEPKFKSTSLRRSRKTGR